MSKERNQPLPESAELNEVKQPYYDFEIAKICVWLKKNGMSMHVTLKGDVSFKKKG